MDAHLADQALALQPQAAPDPDVEGFSERLRRLAFRRVDAEVFNLLWPAVPGFRIGAEDLLVLAAALREATRRLGDYAARGKPDQDIRSIVEFVSQMLEAADLPKKASGSPPFREYFFASIGWYTALRGTPHVERFWNTINDFLRMDLSPVPSGRERLVSEIAHIGRQIPLPEPVDAIVLDLLRRPYLFADPSAYLGMLGYGLHHTLVQADLGGIVDEWLPLWCRFFVAASIRGPGAVRSILPLRTDIHARVNLTVRLSRLLRGQWGGPKPALTLLAMKIDHWLFAGKFLGRPPLGIAWLWLLRHAFQGVRPRRKERPSLRPFAWLRAPKAQPRSGGLRILDTRLLQGTKGDVIVTRAQGGIGDIMTMRPALLELARRRPRGRVIFATNRIYFAAFSTDDPLDLVDIEETAIDVWSFGRWINLTACPEADIESKEKPRVRTNRVDIFARVFRVNSWGFRRRKVRPLSFSGPIEAAARNFIAQNVKQDAPNIGIQFRAAETYKDVPLMLEAARALAQRYNVFVFDNRPIPKREGDLFVAVDDQPLPIAMAIVARLDAVIAPDSSYLHMAGANRVPCLLLTGPTDGKVRADPYPSARYFDARDRLGCVPCWRNEFEKCGLSEGYDSVCMKMLTVPVIVDALERLLAERRESRRAIDFIWRARRA